eukprot:TRINITY_DN9691_c0_g1_i1.p1 TRINITY_DN9691_c0_g1~~TRINITY_DN9691_c0_g1_i1.p1  ORF type:complete len:127 (+),score=13.88 TRINITY_DN9691_c0_g1_i1:145-525(+)
MYYTASWCGACITFGPKLARFQRDHPDDFEVIVLSCDEDETNFRGFMQGKPFLSVPFRSRSRHTLMSSFSAPYIPTLIVLNPDGQVVSEWGRSAVSTNAETCLDGWRRGEAGVSWWHLLRVWKLIN